MAVDLPPPRLPEPSGPGTILAAAEHLPERVLSFGPYRLHLLGEALLDDARIAQLLADAPDLSEAVRALVNAHYRAGWPGIVLHHARVGRRLYLLLLPGRIESVHGDAGLAAYFRGLEGEVLTAAALEPRRALAAIHARRSGRTVEMSLEPGSQIGHHRLWLRQTARSREPRLRIGIGNPGTRFVGRDFVDASATLGGGGGELRLSGRQDLDGGRRYRERAAGVSVVTPHGLFGADGSRIDYARDTDGPALEGRVSTAALSWSVLPYADFERRWVVSLRADAITDEFHVASVNVFEERYASVETSVLYAQSDLRAGWSVQNELAATVRRGVDGDTGSRSDYTSLRPSWRLQLAPPPPTPWSLSIEALAQYSADALPQQQQFVLGGAQALAAWLPGVVAADRGYFGRVTVHGGPVDGFLRVRPSLFMEIGGGQNDADAPVPTLADVGAGLSLSAADWLEASVVAATPLYESGTARESPDAMRAKVYFRIEIRY